jgi:hypothetical protein
MSEMDLTADGRPADALDPLDEMAGELDIEVPEADAVEQHRVDHADQREWPLEIRYDVDPADAVDQEREVDLGDDDYR